MSWGKSDRQRALVLLSGGVDSALCAHLWLSKGYAVEGLFVDFGQAAAGSERVAATAIAEHLGIGLQVVVVDGWPIRGAGELTGRNAFLLTAACFAVGKEPCIVGIGVHAGTPYYDCSPAFIDRIAQLAEEQSDGRVTVVAPLLTWSKREIYNAFQEAALPVSLTHSCESGNAPCGVCLSCKDRQVLQC